MGIYWYFWVSFRCSWSWYDVWLFILRLKTSWHHDDRPRISCKPSILADFVWHDSTGRRGSLLCHYQVGAEVQVPHSAFADIKGKVFILLWSVRFLLPTRPPLILSRLKGIEMPHYYSSCNHQLHHWLGGVAGEVGIPYVAVVKVLGWVVTRVLTLLDFLLHCPSRKREGWLINTEWKWQSWCPSWSLLTPFIGGQMILLNA